MTAGNDILIVEDESDTRALIAQILGDEGFFVRSVGTADACMDEIASALPVLLVLDIWLKGSRMDGIEILSHVKRDYPAIPVIIVSAHGNIEIAVQAIKAGAYDFIEKPIDYDHLMVVVRRALETARLRRENMYYRDQDAARQTMIGSSGSFRNMTSLLNKAASTGARVLLQGPPGAGKSLAARYLHANSIHRHGPFARLNCTAQKADSLSENLFGRSESTGRSTTGLLDDAKGGTLLLEEVAELPDATQGELVRVLASQKFSRVGGSEALSFDARIVSTTSRDLAQAIEQGAFRRQLHDRLNVITVAVPPLAERLGDIPALVEHFMADLHHHQGLPMRQFDKGAITALQTREWPGNIRELRNLVERMLILGDENNPIDSEEVAASRIASAADDPMVIPAEVMSLPLREARARFERAYLRTHIAKFGGSISQTAGFIGLERSALHRRLKTLGLDSHTFKSPDKAALQD